MTLIQLNGVGKTYAGRWVFRNLDWSIEQGVRLGLVGPNGAGKSTVCKIIAGEETAETGDIARARGLVTAYLPQHIAPQQRTAIEVILQARSDIKAVEDELAEISARLGDPAVTEDMNALQRFLHLQERALEKLNKLGVAGVEGEARRKLIDLGVPADHQDRPLAELSGGQRKLVQLVACVMTRPDLLLLDEPETHLDVSARSRLEAFIRGFAGAVVVISHDRYLLDETVDQIAQLDQGRLTIWHGTYSAYAVERELALRRKQAMYVTQQKEIARLEEAIRRFRQWASELPNSADNSGLIKQARNKQRTINRMDKIERPVLERRKMKLSLRQSNRSGQKVIELREVGVRLGGRMILDGVSIEVYRGERLGVIGRNGSGKTSLIKTLAGNLEMSDGSIWAGPSVRAGYFAQNPDPGTGASTPVDVVRSVKPMREDEAVSQLMKFLFTYEQTRQPVDKLSGGERSRLQLLVLMLGEVNLLLLDEPTNNLDIESMEVLEEALEQYDGTMIVVSHDRYFLDRIVDQILEIKDGRVMTHRGGFSSWSARTA